MFPCADGHIIIAAGNDGQFARLCGVLGVPEWAGDPASATNPARVANRATLVPRLAERTGGWPKAELLGRLEAVGVPVGPINSLDEVFGDPHVVARGMRIDLPHPEAAGGSVPGVRSPIVLDGAPAVAARPSPRLGAQGKEILADPAWGGAATPGPEDPSP